MELILWRHAEAEDLIIEDPVLDLDRKLTKKGERHAKKMAKWLNARLPKTARILVSPAKRAQQTAKALGRDFVTLPELSPGATAEAALKAANWPLAVDVVVVIGHQPTLGMAASLALAKKKMPWSVKKGAIWWLSTRVREDKEQFVLEAVLAPEEL